MSSNARKVAELLADSKNISDVDNTATGQFTLPSGTTAQRPGTSFQGAQRFNTTTGAMEFYNGNGWFKISAASIKLTSITGTILVGAASNLTLAGEGFLTSGLIVNFTQTDDSINTNVTVTPSSDSAATVAVPSAVYSNVTAGRVVAIKVTNSDGTISDVVNETAVAAPTGGTITTSGTTRIHTFTSSGTFANTISNLSADYLIVAGGGGGGSDDNNKGGGGGAGGMSTFTSTLSTGSYTATIGAGGAGSTTDANGASGANSTFNGQTMLGGGGGGTQDATGTAGGSGGGAGGGGQSRTGGAGTSGQGNAGGNSNANSPYHSGGGGGKGGVGNDGGDADTPNGGSGATNDYSTGSNVIYAAGGGGTTGAGGSSGVGGAGAGSNNNAGGNATANRGSGGGGGWGSGHGGNGSAGIIVIRYQL